MRDVTRGVAALAAFTAACAAAACGGARAGSGSAATGAAATATGGAAEREVVATVDRMFAAMRTRDTAALRALLAPDLVIVSARVVDTGTVVRRQRAADFLRSVATCRDELRERMWDPEVRVDGGIATLWAPYDFHVGERFSHCGHDAFQLARAGGPGGAWVVTALTYTVRPAPCAQPNRGGGYHLP